MAFVCPCQATAAVPQFGAQIWIEPGQTPEQIDGWFATLEAGHMPVARLFMMWSYLEPKPNGWDWSLYDAAFRSASGATSPSWQRSRRAGRQLGWRGTTRRASA